MIIQNILIYTQAFLGPISPDFLRISTSRELQESNDREAALYYQHQQQNIAASQPYMVGLLLKTKKRTLNSIHFYYTTDS